MTISRNSLAVPAIFKKDISKNLKNTGSFENTGNEANYGLKSLSIFGSTGSVGKNVIEVIKKSPSDFAVLALVARNDYENLVNQALELNQVGIKPDFICIADEKNFQKLKKLAVEKNLDCQVLAGMESMLELAKIRCDLMVSAIVGVAGLQPTFLAIQAGSNVALANKESLVCAGEILVQAAKKNGASIIPVDSEHNAIFQIFDNKNLAGIADITLTASGGPFFGSNIDFSKITISQALKHPNWQMGEKISIDSATMMNKGLELIEAYHLFPISEEKIKILVHPQSIIHGLVNYCDGSSLAMMSLPDMKVPISYALNFPVRSKIAAKQLDLTKLQKLEFFAVDEEKFVATKLCRQALKNGGNAPVILNSANEVAVERFLKQEITFDKITKIVETCLQKLDFAVAKSLDEILEIDAKCREFAQKMPGNF